MIGIEFEKENEYDNFLKDMFDNFSLKNKIVSIEESEIFNFNLNNQTIAGNEFIKAIKNSRDYYILFAKITIIDEEKASIPIETYNDFINSKCNLLILIHDGIYVEIYFNDNELKEKILHNLSKKKIKYRIKTIKNDTRTKMSVL